MRVAVISDIHGNRHALEAVLDDVEALAVDELWCLGDVVGYGAEPNACVGLVRRYATVCLAGNHDLAVLGEVPVESFSTGARVAAQWTRDQLTLASVEYLARLRPSSLEEVVGLYHASPRDPVWEYVLSDLGAELSLDALDPRHRVACIGHSHVALAFSRSLGVPASGEPKPAGTLLDLTEGQWLLNPGSVGQPRDGDPRAAWLLLDTDAWTVRYQRIEYDVAGAAAAIRAARLPDSLAERLPHGQ